MTKGCGRGRKSDGITEIFRCHPHLGLENNKQNLIFNSSRDWKPMEMFLDVGGDMGVTGKSGNEYIMSDALTLPESMTSSAGPLFSSCPCYTTCTPTMHSFKLCNSLEERAKTVAPHQSLIHKQLYCSYQIYSKASFQSFVTDTTYHQTHFNVI